MGSSGKTRRQREVEALYDALSSLDPDARARELNARCGGDAALRDEVAALFTLDERAERFFAGLATRSGIAPPDTEAALDESGRRIGAYRLIRVLGRGGMGVVYLAERADAQFHKEVALKFPPVWLSGAFERKRFEREREILARLEHPRIARLLDGGVTDEGAPYYVMEYVRGQPINVYCEARQLNLDQRLALFEQVCEAVAYAHRQLIIHRDLKPENILVNDQGEPKLLDFGIARWISSDREFDATATAVADRRLTPAFAAPELFRGDPATVACDVYALGVVLYELLTGRQPHEVKGSGTGDWLEAHERTLRPPSRVTRSPRRAARLRGELDNILGMALQPDPARRYATAEAFARDLRGYREGRPVTAVPDSRLYRARRFVTRHRVGVGAAAFALLLVVGFAAASGYYAVRLSRQAELIELQRDRALATSRFLVNLFRVANPYVSQEHRLTARDLVNRGLRELETRRDLPLETRAVLYHTLAEVLYGLSQFEMARVALMESVVLTRRAYGAQSGEYARVLADLARYEYTAGELQAARRHLTTALARHGTRPATRAVAWYRLGRVLNAMGRYPAAIEAAGHSMAAWRAADAPSRSWIARATVLRGTIAFHRGRLDAAQARYAEARRVLEAGPGEHAIVTALVRERRAQLAGRRYRYERAHRLYAGALSAHMKIFGSRHLETALTRSRMSRALLGLGRRAEARAGAARAVQNLNDLLGADNWLVARAEVALALVLADTGDFQWAASLLEHALAVYRHTFEAPHRRITGVLAARSYLFNQMGQFRQAERSARRAAATLGALAGRTGRLERRVQVRLAISLLGQGKTSAARALARQYCGAHPAPWNGPLNARTPPCRMAEARGL